MRHFRFLVLSFVLGAFLCAGAIELFPSGTKFVWQSHARLTLINGKTVEGVFLVSDPWLVVLPTTQDHSEPCYWKDVISVEMLGGSSALIRKADGSSFKAKYIYGIASGDRLYFYTQSDRPGTKQIYVLPLNEREKPTPEFVHLRKVEFLETPQIADPVLYNDYR